jgi:hypothetical protein
MGIATHLGPWLLGTVKNTTGTTAGLIRNTGATTVLQTATFTAPTGISAAAPYTGPNTNLNIVIPAGSAIHAIIADTTVDFVGASLATTLTFKTGNATTGLATNIAAGSTIATVTATSTITGRATATINATNIAICNNTGTTDLILQVAFATAGNYTSGGTANIQVVYAVRNPDGTAAPSVTTGP